MIRAKSEQPAYHTIVSSEHYQSVSDAPVSKGGAGAGFDPHELLEASLAACLNIVIRKRAAQMSIKIESVETVVRVDRTHNSVTTFEYDIDIQGAVDASQKEALVESIKTCPVSQTLSKRIVFTKK